VSVPCHLSFLCLPEPSADSDGAQKHAQLGAYGGQVG
jgi:hypothetical protein